jgi:putative transposase
LSNDAWRAVLARCVDAAGQQQAFSLVAFIFMPEHVHLLVLPCTTTPNVPGYLVSIKEPMSKSVKALLAEHRSPLVKELTIHERPGKEAFRYWQEGPGYDRNLQTADAVISAIDYIHANPVRRGLVQRNCQWVWSSASFYESDGRKHDRRCPTVMPLPAEYFQGYVGRKTLPGT